MPGFRLRAAVFVLDYGSNNIHHAYDAQHDETQGNVEGREVERGLGILEEAVDSDLGEDGEHQGNEGEDNYQGVDDDCLRGEGQRLSW